MCLIDAAPRRQRVEDVGASELFRRRGKVHCQHHPPSRQWRKTNRLQTLIYSGNILRHNKVSVLCWSTSEQLKRIACFTINSDIFLHHASSEIYTRSERALRIFPCISKLMCRLKMWYSAARQKQKHQKACLLACVSACECVVCGFINRKRFQRRILNYQALCKFPFQEHVKSCRELGERGKLAYMLKASSEDGCGEQTTLIRWCLTSSDDTSLLLLNRNAPSSNCLWGETEKAFDVFLTLVTPFASSCGELSRRERETDESGSQTTTTETSGADGFGPREKRRKAFYENW